MHYLIHLGKKKKWTVTYQLSARPGILRSQPLPFDPSYSHAWRSTASHCPSPGGTFLVPEWSPWWDLRDFACPSNLWSPFFLCSILLKALRVPAPAAQTTSVHSLQSDLKSAWGDEEEGSAAMWALLFHWKRKLGVGRRWGDSWGWNGKH